jgi:transglutaminase-like putative cysteine protease
VQSGGQTRTKDLLENMTHAIKREFVYRRRHESGVQNPLDTLRTGMGTCRDFAVFMMEAARSLGYAARFVSGYLHVRATDKDRVGGGSTHAWVQVYLPSAGWVEFDPTNGIVGNNDLIRVAIAREPRQAIPLWGSYTGSPSDHLAMKVNIRVVSEAGA